MSSFFLIYLPHPIYLSKELPLDKSSDKSVYPFNRTVRSSKKESTVDTRSDLSGDFKGISE